MERFVLIGVVCLLEHGDIVGAALAQVSVVVCVDRVYLEADHPEIFAGDAACLTDVFHVALSAAFAGEDQDLLHSRVRYYLHLVLDLVEVQLHPGYVVVAVETAVNAVVFTVIRYVKRREQVNAVAEVLSGLQSGFLRHFLEERFCSR